MEYQQVSALLLVVLVVVTALDSMSNAPAALDGAMTTLLNHQQRPHLVVTNHVQEEVIDFLSEFARVTANRSREPWSRRELLETAADADGLLMFMPDCVDADFLDHCPRLGSIAGALRGFDNFDLSACDARGIRYQFIPNLLAAPTAELTVAILISLARSIPAGDAFVRTGQFPGGGPISTRKE